jgi:hypothetical protein
MPALSRHAIAAAQICAHGSRAQCVERRANAARWNCVKKTSGLTVRQYERAGIQVPVEFVVCNEHGVQVRFSPQSGTPDHHVVAAVAVDISSGGLGMECRSFIPRMTEGLVRISNGGDVLLEQRAKVRRVYSVGREPKYMIGLSFMSPPEDIESRIRDIVARFEADVAGRAGATHA